MRLFEESKRAHSETRQDISETAKVHNQLVVTVVSSACMLYITQPDAGNVSEIEYRFAVLPEINCETITRFSIYECAGLMIGNASAINRNKTTKQFNPLYFKYKGSSCFYPLFYFYFSRCRIKNISRLFEFFPRNCSLLIRLGYYCSCPIRLFCRNRSNSLVAHLCHQRCSSYPVCFAGAVAAAAI